MDDGLVFYLKTAARSYVLKIEFKLFFSKIFCA